MAWRDETRRWIKDRLSRNEDLAFPQQQDSSQNGYRETERPKVITPKEAIADVATHLDKLSANERNQRLEHLKAYMTVYYQGRHNERTPQDVQQQLKGLSERTERLKDVDRDRLALARFGGAPTRETTQEAIHRSTLERERQLSPQPVNERQREVGSQRQVLGQRERVQEQPTMSSHATRNHGVENSPAPVQYVEWINPEVMGASQNSVTNRAVHQLETAVETPSVELDLGVSV